MLANAVGHLEKMSADLTPSRAGSLPQGICAVRVIFFNTGDQALVTVSTLFLVLKQV